MVTTFGEPCRKAPVTAKVLDADTLPTGVLAKEVIVDGVAVNEAVPPVPVTATFIESPPPTIVILPLFTPVLCGINLTYIIVPFNVADVYGTFNELE